MEQYKLPSHINLDKIFIVNRSELEGRIDPQYFSFKKSIISKFIHPSCRLKDFL